MEFQYRLPGLSFVLNYGSARLLFRVFWGTACLLNRRSGTSASAPYRRSFPSSSSIPGSAPCRPWMTAGTCGCWRPIDLWWTGCSNTILQRILAACRRTDSGTELLLEVGSRSSIAAVSSRPPAPNAKPIAGQRPVAGGLPAESSLYLRQLR